VLVPVVGLLAAHRPEHRGPDLPVRRRAAAAVVAPDEGGVGERLPELLRRRADVADVDEVVGHVGLLEGLLEIGEGLRPRPVVPPDPPVGDVVDRGGVEVVVLLASVPRRDDEPRRLEHAQVLGDGLARHRQPLAELPQRLAATGVQRVEQSPSTGVGERPEHLVHHRSDHATIWLPVRQ
jgi:hypothetical protein